MRKVINYNLSRDEVQNIIMSYIAGIDKSIKSVDEYDVVIMKENFPHTHLEKMVVEGVQVGLKMKEDESE